MKKIDSSETLRTTETMKKKARLFSRCLISIMKVFRMCKKSRKNTGRAWKNTKMFFYVFGRGLMTFISFADLAAFFASCASRFCSRAFFLRASPWSQAKRRWLFASLRGGWRLASFRGSASLEFCARGRTNELAWKRLDFLLSFLYW